MTAVAHLAVSRYRVQQSVPVRANGACGTLMGGLRLPGASHSTGANFAPSRPPDPSFNRPITHHTPSLHPLLPRINHFHNLKTKISIHIPRPLIAGNTPNRHPLLLRPLYKWFNNRPHRPLTRSQRIPRHQTKLPALLTLSQTLILRSFNISNKSSIDRSLLC